MNTNGTNPGMNVEDYEDKAVQKSNMAKRMAVGGAVFLGGAAVAGGAAYAASQQTDGQPAGETLTTDDLLNGAEVGEEYKPEEEPQETHTTTEHVVIVEKPAPDIYKEEAKEAEDPDINWKETTNIYVGDTKIGSIEEGTVDGRDFALIDTTGDDMADAIAIDANDNKIYDENEFMALNESDGIRMGNPTDVVTNERYNGYEDVYNDDQNLVAQNEDPIYNNFEDEKTGESYHGDFAENNPDYNPDAPIDSYDGRDGLLAENDSYTEDYSYTAEMNDLQTAEVEIQDPSEQPFDGMEYAEDLTDYKEDYEENDLYTNSMAGTGGNDDYDIAADGYELDDSYTEDLADIEGGDESSDSMMGSEEFLG